MLHYDIEKMNNNFTKHHLNINGVGFVVHEFKAPDVGHIHDHPFSFNSFIIKGWYIERIYYIDHGWWSEDFLRKEGESHRVEAETIHEILEMSDGGCLTIITPEEKTQDWKFWKFDNEGVWTKYPYEQEFTLLKTNK